MLIIRSYKNIKVTEPQITMSAFLLSSSHSQALSVCGIFQKGKPPACLLLHLLSSSLSHIFPLSPFPLMTFSVANHHSEGGRHQAPTPCMSPGNSTWYRDSLQLTFHFSIFPFPSPFCYSLSSSSS